MGGLMEYTGTSLHYFQLVFFLTTIYFVINIPTDNSIMCKFVVPDLYTTYQINKHRVFSK